jgi:hypothetical protein
VAAVEAVEAVEAAPGARAAGDSLAEANRTTAGQAAAVLARHREWRLAGAIGTCLPQDVRPGLAFRPGARAEYGVGGDAVRGTVRHVAGRNVTLHLDAPLAGTGRRVLTTNYAALRLLPPGQDAPLPRNATERRQVQALRAAMLKTVEVRAMTAQLTDLTATVRRRFQLPLPGDQRWEATRDALVAECHREHARLRETAEVREEIGALIGQLEQAHADHYAELLAMGVEEEVLPPKPRLLVESQLRLKPVMTAAERRRLAATRVLTNGLVARAFGEAGPAGLSNAQLIAACARPGSDDALAVTPARVLGMLSAFVRQGRVAPLPGAHDRWRLLESANHDNP